MSKAYHRVHNIFSDEKRKEMVELANRPGAFVDNSYGISFYKHPLQLDDLEIDGVWQVQMLRQTVKESKIHKDRNRNNEFDNIYMPRNAVISWPIQGDGDTIFYDDDKNIINRVSYNNDGAILNTGGYFHNVILNTEQPRIMFQMCFDSSFDDVVSFYEGHLKDERY
jgi:hypothetical protein